MGFELTASDMLMGLIDSIDVLDHDSLLIMSDGLYKVITRPPNLGKKLTLAVLSGKTEVTNGTYFIEVPPVGKDLWLLVKEEDLGTSFRKLYSLLTSDLTKVILMVTNEVGHLSMAYYLINKLRDLGIDAEVIVILELAGRSAADLGNSSIFIARLYVSNIVKSTIVTGLLNSRKYLSEDKYQEKIGKCVKELLELATKLPNRILNTPATYICFSVEFPEVLKSLQNFINLSRFATFGRFYDSKRLVGWLRSPKELLYSSEIRKLSMGVSNWQSGGITVEVSRELSVSLVELGSGLIVELLREGLKYLRDKTIDLGPIARHPGLRELLSNLGSEPGEETG